jgi:hypothetical protein
MESRHHCERASGDGPSDQWGGNKGTMLGASTSLGLQEGTCQYRKRATERGAPTLWSAEGTRWQKESTHEPGNLSIGLDRRNEYEVQRVSASTAQQCAVVESASGSMRRDE